MALAMESATLGHACSDQITTGDQRRTEGRYKAAVTLLKDALERRPGSWSSMGQFDDILDNQDNSKLQGIIEKRLDLRRSSSNPSIWKKGRKLFERVFVVMFPLARNLLTIANEGQAVLQISLISVGFLLTSLPKLPILNPCGLVCTALLLLLSVCTSLWLIIICRLPIANSSATQKLKRS